MDFGSMIMFGSVCTEPRPRPMQISIGSVHILSGFPLGLENLEKWEGIFQSGKSQGILNRLEKSGKTTPNTGKLREFQKKSFVIFQ